MARFPVNESDTLILAQDMIQGFQNHPDIFPNPPVSISALQQDYNNNVTNRDTENRLRAELQDAKAKHLASYENLADEMKAALRYAEFAVKDDTQLALLGWSGRASAASLAPPAQPRSLSVLDHGNGAVSLAWKVGIGGGKAAAYDIQRRDSADTGWQHIVTAIDVQIVLTAQPPGKLLEYRVIAVNRAGVSDPSNSVETSA